MSTTTPPDLAPPPLRENSRKKEKIWENFSPTYRQYKKWIRQQLLYLYPPTRSGPPPPDLDPPPSRSGPRVLAFVFFFEKISEILHIFLRFLVFFVLEVCWGKITPSFLKVVHVVVFSFSFFQDIKSKFSFLGDLKLQPHHTIPQHWKQSKDFQECLGPGVSSGASLFLFLYVFCWCYSNFLRLLHPQAFIGY